MYFFDLLFTFFYSLFISIVILLYSKGFSFTMFVHFLLLARFIVFGWLLTNPIFKIYNLITMIVIFFMFYDSFLIIYNIFLTSFLNDFFPH
jgi:hypothetical protein